MAPYGAPGPAGPINVPGMEDTYAPLGLAGLAQGFTHGLEIGQQWGHQADQLAQQGRLADATMQMHRDQMSNEADWRKTNLEATNQRAREMQQGLSDRASAALAEKTAHDTEMEAIREKLAEVAAGKPGASATAKTQKNLGAAASAYMAMDNYRDLAKGFAPESSGPAAAALAPLEWIKSKVSQTSAPNNLADKAGEAATMYATAVNSAGGGRMSEAEIHNMAKAMGGNAIGETQLNLDQKHNAMKNELAAKMGVSRQEVEEYIASRAQGGGAPPPPRAHGNSQPPAGFEPHVNRKTGQTAYINAKTGEMWQP